MRGKKRAVLIVLAAAVLALAAFCLWYARPRPLTALLRAASPEDPVS